MHTPEKQGTPKFLPIQESGRVVVRDWAMFDVVVLVLVLVDVVVLVLYLVPVDVVVLVLVLVLVDSGKQMP